MTEKIPKEINDEFSIINENIKYPTYPDNDFQQSILDEFNLGNYSKEKTKKDFNEFLRIFKSCKDSTYEIIDKNLHNIQQYCSDLNEKAMNYILYFYIIEKFVNLIEKKYFKSKINVNLKKKLFFGDTIFACCEYSQNISTLFKNEFRRQNDINLLAQIFTPIMDRYNKLLNSKNEIGNIIIRIIKYLTKYLFIPLEEELDKFKNIDIFYEENFFKTKINEENEIILLSTIYYLKRLEHLDLIFYNSALLNKNDICNLEQNANEWKDLEQILFRVIPKNAEEIRNKIVDSRKHPHIGNSIISNIKIDESPYSTILSGLKNYIYYKSNENKSIIDSLRYQITNRPENLKELFKIIKKFKFIINTIMPSIQFRRKIYVKKEYPPLNRMYIERLINFTKGENNPINTKHPKNSNKYNNIINESLPLIFKDKLPQIYKKYKRNYVSITIIHTENIYFKDEKKEENIFSSIMKTCGKEDEYEHEQQIENKFRNNTIMITIHGGGFITSSTFMQEKYLRKWANILNIPIFGINYSLSPEYEYPEALNDVYQAYLWIIRHAKEELNMDIRHIILSGDSAGGSLALGLNNLLLVIKDYEAELQNYIILPELIVANYPVTYINLKNISNSLLLSLYDPMLNINAITYIYKAYVDRYEIEDEDPFLNPIKVNDFILDRTKSKIRIFFGSEDVFREDCIRLLNIFNKYNSKENNSNFIDSRGYDILYLGHAFNMLSEETQQIGQKVIIPEIEDFLNNIK